MGKMVWDQQGERFYETGVDHCALYTHDGTAYENGVAWNGITAINERPSGAEATALYADNIKYLNLISAEDFAATIEAYTYPDEFMECDGSKPLAEGVGAYASQQKRKTFGLAYRTLMGNDTQGTNYGYQLHIIYGGTAAVSERNYATVNDSPEAITFSWEVSTTPVPVGEGFNPTAHLTIASTKFDATTKVNLENLEAVLFGRDASSSGGTTVKEIKPQLITPAEVLAILQGGSIASYEET